MGILHKYQATFVYDEGIVYVSYPEQYEITLEDVIEHNRQHNKVNPNGKIYLCIDMNNLRSIEKAAKKFYLEPEIGAQYGAMAMVTQKLTPLVIGRMFLSLDQPVFPGKMFEDMDTAVEWLNKIRKEDENSENSRGIE